MSLRDIKQSDGISVAFGGLGAYDPGLDLSGLYGNYGSVNILEHYILLPTSISLFRMRIEIAIGLHSSADQSRDHERNSSVMRTCTAKLSHAINESVPGTKIANGKHP